MVRKFYVYALVDPRTDRVFYIGKGKVGRNQVHLRQSINGTHYNPKLRNKINKIREKGLVYGVEFLFSSEDEKACLEMEITWIAFYGLENLCNLTLGGDGTSGFPCSEEHKTKLKAAWVRRRLLNRSLSLALLFLWVAHVAQGLELTHYGYPGDPNGDPQSAAGQGAFGFDTQPGSLQNINASGVIAAALSPDVVAQYNLSPGQEFTVTSGGQTYNLVFADKTADNLTGRIDLYDPNGTFQGSGTQVTALNGGSIIEGGPVGAGGAGGPLGIVETINVQVVDLLLGKFQHAGQAWVVTFQNAATWLFWILATISLVWTGAMMVLRRAELGEIMVELFRYIMFTGFFFWLLLNGPAFAGDIINSLRQLGGQAAGGGQAIYPGDLITAGVTVVNNAMTHMNWLLPAVTGIPVIIAVIILVVCCLISANLVLLLIAAWVVLYAGLIFLGFGGCRWTSDWAIGYWKTVLGIGVSLMTMELVIGIGNAFLQELIAATGDTGDIGALMAVMAAVIILAVIAHQLPKMVAGMVQGGGYGGHVGGIGIMSLIGAGIAGSSIARSIAGGGVGAVAAAGTSAMEKLMERIAVLETANAAVSSSAYVPPSPPATSRMASTVLNSATPESVQGGMAAPISRPVTTMPVIAEAEAAAEDLPPDTPILPDESRGFEPPSDFIYPDEPV